MGEATEVDAENTNTTKTFLKKENKKPPPERVTVFCLPSPHPNPLRSNREGAHPSPVFWRRDGDEEDLPELIFSVIFHRLFLNNERVVQW